MANDTLDLSQSNHSVRQLLKMVDNSDGTFSIAISSQGTATITPSVLTPAAPAAVSVGVTSGLAVAANASRKGLTLVNTSANIISIGLGVAAVLYSGITLNASGGAFEMGIGSKCTSAVYAIASGATSNLAIQEFS
jgi:hypothetical protein